jgi:hypothetical protein
VTWHEPRKFEIRGHTNEPDFPHSVESPLCTKGTSRAEAAERQIRGETMLPDTPSVTQLSQVITQVTAPSFLVGAVAAFISVLIARMNRIIHRSQALNAIDDDDTSKARLKMDIPRLKRRAMLLNKAILFSTLSAIVTSLLVIVAFVCAFYNLQHEYGVTVLFIVALALFTLSLVNLAREARIGLHEFDHFR